MGALGHFLERQGIATTGISLVREHTETIRPPRALWVTFELGRPLGIPDDAPFQRRVVKAALDLLARTDGPLIADYPEHVDGADRLQRLGLPDQPRAAAESIRWPRRSIGWRPGTTAPSPHRAARRSASRASTCRPPARW